MQQKYNLYINQHHQIDQPPNFIEISPFSLAFIEPSKNVLKKIDIQGVLTKNSLKNLFSY